nr:hypertrehalosaemic prohormone-like [Onthophagus taurus]
MRIPLGLHHCYIDNQNCMLQNSISNLKKNFVARFLYVENLMMYRFLMILAILIALEVVTAQINFSTGWGKRSQGNFPVNNCNPSMDAAFVVYKIIQTEAQKLIECDKGVN